MAQTTPGNPTARPACIGGLYEICVGVTDLAESIAYYERFGCRAGRFGTLDAAAAQALYLLIHAHAAVYGDASELGLITQVVDDLAGLLGQLTRG
jgi:catechol 2,3-dioxygenase-like lactoylglutathione lyase family enzyme